MKPHNPPGDFARTINWAHFWHCMKKPHYNPQLLPNMRAPLAREKAPAPVIIAIEERPGAGMQRVVLLGKRAANAK